MEVPCVPVMRRPKDGGRTWQYYCHMGNVLSLCLGYIEVRIAYVFLSMSSILPLGFGWPGIWLVWRPIHKQHHRVVRLELEKVLGPSVRHSPTNIRFEELQSPNPQRCAHLMDILAQVPA